jgi:hypothetical protein
MKPVRLISMTFALALAAAAVMLTPAAAAAKTASATMTIGSYDFLTGKPTPDPISGTVRVTPGSSVTLTAPQYLYEPPATPTASPTVYEFIFWDANATLGTKEKDTFTAPPTASAFKATAWYVPVGGCSGTCVPAVSASAFSLTNYAPLPGSPIGSVSPSSAQTGPNSVSTTSAAVISAGAVKITAANCLGPCTKFLRTTFVTWFQLGDGKIANPLLTVPADGSSIAIAFYRSLRISPPPPPCGGSGEPPCGPRPM